LTGQGSAIDIFALYIERDHRRALRDNIGERDRLLDHAFAGIVGAALPDFDNFDIAQAEIAAGLRRAFAKALGKLGFRALFQASNGGNDNPHRAAGSIACDSALAPRNRSPSASNTAAFDRRREFEWSGDDI